MKTLNRAAHGFAAQSHRRILLSRWIYYLSSVPTLFSGVSNWVTMLRVFVGPPVERPIEISLRNGLRFRVRTRLDIWVLKEACLDRQYEAASVKIEDGWSVVDIGAGIGDFAVSSAREHPRASIAAYEPFPDSFALLQENLLLNKIGNVRALPLAVGVKNGSLRLHAVSGEAVQRSTVACADGDGIPVESVTLDQVIEALQAPRCDYLKMDCEGAEYGILFNSSPATLARIRHVCLEYHDDVTQYTHLDLVRLFEQNGFAVRVFPNCAHWQWGLLSASNERIQNGPQ